MKTSTLWEQYQHYTRDLTENARTLGFAAGAICWLFKPADEVAFSPAILCALGFLVLFFVCDILHHFVAALVLKRFTEREEARLWNEAGSLEGEVNKPRSIDRPAFGFFIAKVSVLLLTFAAIAVEFVYRILRL